MKTNRLVTSMLALGLLTIVSAPALAHHGNAAYADNVTEFKNATVTKINWANPHVLIDWQKATLNPGDVVTVRMYVAKNGNPAGRLNKIIMADGTELHDTQLGGDAGGKTRYDPDAGK